MQAYWQDMARHGMTSATLYNYAGHIYDEAGQPAFEGNADIAMLRDWIEAGLVHADVPIMFLGTIEAFAAEAVAAEAARRGYPELLLYGWDEPPVSRAAREAFEALQPVREHLRVLTAISDRAASAFADLLDIWVVNGGCITPALQTLAEEWGAEVWTYDCHHRGHGNAPWSRHYAGLYTWALGLKGNFLWAYTENYSWEGDRNSIFCYVLPSDQGPVPSVEWEARREGVEDYRTLRLLESMAAGSPASALGQEALAWLEEIRARVDWYLARDMPPSMYPWDGPQLYPMCPNLDPGEFAQIRAQAQDYVLALMDER